MSWPVRKTTAKKTQKQTKKTHHKTKNTTSKSTHECASFIANISAGFISYPRTMLGSLYSSPKLHVGIAPCSKYEGYWSQEEEEKSCVGNNYAELRLPLVQWWKQKERCPSVERHQPGPASFWGRGGGNFFFFFSMECFMNLCVSLWGPC